MEDIGEHLFCVNTARKTSVREIEMAATLREVHKDTRRVQDMAEAYKMASKKNWQGFKEFYAENGIEALFTPVTVNRANAFHIAAISKDTQLLRDLLGMLPDASLKYEALRSLDVHGNTPLHEVTTTDCVSEAKLILSEIYNYQRNDELQQMEHLLNIRNKLGETALYRSAALGQTKVMQYLTRVTEQVENLLHHCHNEEDTIKYLQDHFHRKDHISILHIAVIGQHFETAIWLLKRDKELAHRKEKNGMTCLHLLALMQSAFRSTRPMSKWKSLVYYCLPIFSDDDDNNEANDNNNEGELSTLTKDQDLETGKNHSGNRCQREKHNVYTPDQVTQNGAISKMWVGMCRPLIRGWPIINNIWKEKKRHKSAIELVRLLIESDLSWRECAEGDPKDDETISLGLGPGKGGHNTKEGREGDETKADEMTPRSLNPETPLILAASTGIEEIFDEITNRFPQAVDYVTEDGRNVLHLAIMFRQEKIFKRIKKMEMSLPKLASRIDNYGNTILHYVADMTYYPGGTRPGPALQFQEELEWYQRVENLVPSHYAMHRNKKEKTAKELFTGTHEDLHKKAQEWMKDTSQSCSTVAILVATVVFAAAYTVPGGVNSENGLPILLDSPLFKLFAVMDVVSLGSSLTSVVMFLSILTSPFQQDNFLDSLPRKLTIGFTFLFLSVLTTMITFTASILLTVRLGKRWTSTLIYSASFIPVMIFALIMFPWYAAFVGTSIKLIVKIKKALPERKKTN